MAHYAEIDKNNKVLRVVVVDNEKLLVDGVESEKKGADFCYSLFGGDWIQTSYNNNIRKQFAGIGYIYDAVNDVFIAPHTYPSWSLDENFDWQAPTPRPEEGFWNWDEDLGNWVNG